LLLDFAHCFVQEVKLRIQKISSELEFPLRLSLEMPISLDGSLGSGRVAREPDPPAGQRPPKTAGTYAAVSLQAEPKRIPDLATTPSVRCELAQTTQEWNREVRSAGNRVVKRLRRAGAGRKTAVSHQSGLPAALDTLIEGAIRGDPCPPLLWVSRSQRHLVKALAEQGFKASQWVVVNLLRQMKYSCQANRKTREGSNHPDRDAQFQHINATVKQRWLRVSRQSRWTRRRRSWSATSKTTAAGCDPEKVRVHDFKIPEFGKVASYGVYDVAANHG